MASILIAGAGPSGCAFAVTAVRRGHAVTMLDEGRRRPPWTGESLPAGGGELLESVFGTGVLDGQAISHGTAAAWSSPELIAHDYMAHWAGAGWHVDRIVLDARLRQACAAAGVTIRTGAAPASMSDHDWIVDATGRAGAVAARRSPAGLAVSGATQVRFDDQIALVATVADRGGARVTTVESCAAGWWYSQPVPGGDRVVALITDADLVEGDRTSFWTACLAETRHMREFVVAEPATVAAYPSGTAAREPIVGDDWIAVGDAAVSLDPMSSQGLITGIVMAAHAAIAIDAGAPALADWAADYRVVLDEHLHLRAAYWAEETRWSDSPFWMRRSTSMRSHPQ